MLQSDWGNEKKQHFGVDSRQKRVILPKINYSINLQMKSLHKTALLMATLLLSLAVFTSCDWDNSPEPEHPTMVTYQISADYTEYVGPDQLLLDIQTWVEENKTGYAANANYSTGAASEFVKQDQEAAKVMDSFTVKFKNYLETTVKAALAAGTYGSKPVVKATFYTYTYREQGEERSVKTAIVNFAYPDNGSTDQ